MAIIRDGDYFVDDVTGEVVGHARFGEDFHINTLEDAKFVLQKMRGCDTRLFALAAEKASILSDITRMEKDIQRQKDYLNWRFTPQLERLAQEKLEGNSRKTLQTPFGKFGYRVTRGSIAVNLDQEAECLQQVAHLVANGILPLSAIKITRKILVSNIPDSVIAQMPEYFIKVDPVEKFFVDTSVKEVKDTVKE